MEAPEAHPRPDRFYARHMLP
eukprot:SAG31_NODE_42902_length_269_cov_0.917647_2_plen_20_part_01